MVTPPIEMAGQRFGRLVVLERAGKDRWGRSIWLCECDCGTRKPITQHNLRQGFTISCGCYRRDYHSKHGRAGESLYKRWQALRQRCQNPNDKRYADYGGRGIRCVPEWDDFAAFSEWAHANGYHPNLQIDRIDNDGPYSPENCRWVDAKTNMANRRTTTKLLIHGEEMSLTEASRRFGIHKNTLRGRLKSGIPPEQAIKRSEEIYGTNLRRRARAPAC